MTKCRNIKASNKTFFCRFRGQKFGKVKEMPTLETFLVQNFAHEILKIGFDILLLIFVLRKLCTALLFSETSTSCNLLWGAPFAFHAHRIYVDF